MTSGRGVHARESAVAGAVVAPTSGWLRWARGALVGATAGLLSVGAHVLAAPGPVPVVPALGIVALAVLGSVALSGQRWTLPALVAVLTGMQVVGHVILAGTAPSGAGAFGHEAAHVAAASGASGVMVLAHVAAIVVAAMVLRGGEDVCWRLGELATRPLQRALRMVDAAAPPLARRALLVTGRPGSLQSRLRSDVVRLRGPPAPAR